MTADIKALVERLEKASMDTTVLEYGEHWNLHAEAVIALTEQAREIEGLRYEKARFAAMFEAAVNQLVRIKSFVHPDGFVVNGKGYSFHPPIELVREAWETLSKAIREIEPPAPTPPQAVLDAYTRCADQVPSTWIDPLLSGPDAVILGGSDGKEIEALLSAVRKRILAARDALKGKP